MRRATALLLALALAPALWAAPASAGTSCHAIDATGAGEGSPAQPGDPPGLVRTVAQIRDGGLLQGTTEAAFQIPAGSEPPVLPFSGDLTFSANRGTLTVHLDGHLDLTDGTFAATGPVTAATGKLDGADGMLSFAGTQDLTDPDGAFTETVVGEICVDLAGNGRP